MYPTENLIPATTFLTVQCQVQWERPYLKTLPTTLTHQPFLTDLSSKVGLCWINMPYCAATALLI